MQVSCLIPAQVPGPDQERIHGDFTGNLGPPFLFMETWFIDCSTTGNMDWDMCRTLLHA